MEIQEIIDRLEIEVQEDTEENPHLAARAELAKEILDMLLEATIPKPTNPKAIKTEEPLKPAETKPKKGKK